MNHTNNDHQIKTKQVTLFVRQDFEIPIIFTNGSVEEIEEALFIGDTIQRSIKSHRSSDEASKIIKQKDEEIQRIRASFQVNLQKLTNDIQEITLQKENIAIDYTDRLNAAKSEERKSCAIEWEEKNARLRRENESLTSRCEALEARRRELEVSRDKDIQDAITRSEANLQKLLTFKGDQLIKMESTYRSLQESISKQSDEISKLSVNLGKRSANAKTKGSDYEEQFREKLERNYFQCHGFKLRKGNVHEMDFVLEMEGHVVMWEVKDYSGVVPTKEVDKFLRDLKDNPQAKIGIMISRTTTICGKSESGSMSTEFDNGKMMIYINTFEKFCGEDENRVFQMLTSVFRVWWEYQREEKNTVDSVEMLRELEKVIEEISKRRKEWSRHKQNVDKMTSWMEDQLAESERELDRVLKRARHTE